MKCNVQHVRLINGEDGDAQKDHRVLLRGFHVNPPHIALPTQEDHGETYGNLPLILQV